MTLDVRVLAAEFAFVMGLFFHPEQVRKGQRDRRIPGSVRPALVSCQVWTMRWMTVIVETTEITQSAGAIRLKIPPRIKRTMRSGRSMKPTLHSGISDSARARE